MKQWYQDRMYARVIRMDGRVDRVQLDCMEDCGTLIASFPEQADWTDIRTVADTLNGEKHRAAMAETLGELGVSDFEVRYASAARAEEKDGVEQLKKDFSGYTIEVKS